MTIQVVQFHISRCLPSRLKGGGSEARMSNFSMLEHAYGIVPMRSRYGAWTSVAGPYQAALIVVHRIHTIEGRSPRSRPTSDPGDVQLLSHSRNAEANNRVSGRMPIKGSRYSCQGDLDRQADSSAPPAHVVLSAQVQGALQILFRKGHAISAAAQLAAITAPYLAVSL